MVIIGLTGGIGTGKSTVSRVLARAGATIIDAVLVGHEVYETGTATWKAVSQTFGSDILLPDQQIDRKKLGEIVFNDPSALAKLNAIMRPAMEAVLAQRLQAAADRGDNVAVLDSATLVEAGWTSLVDEVWMVSAPSQNVAQRLKERDSLSDTAIKARVASQITDHERAAKADVVIENNGSLEELTAAIKALWAERIEAKVRNNGAS
ncbi:MAG: dephospho-CoA kinase [SAR202 cluster bacterium]|nr:dephospho-CoA kinase [SAR202 cluster bacterium]|tara:strand:+ start:286 stop:906 length:621 start_codon:yes stop_codon:yes gene_type:complete